MKRIVNIFALCLVLAPIISSAELSLDLPDHLQEQLGVKPGKGKVPVYAISMEIEIHGESMSKNIGVLAGDTAVLSFLDDAGQAGYEIRVNTPESTSRLGEIAYGKMKLMVLRTGEQKKILAEPLLMSPLNGDRLQVVLGGGEEEAISIAMRVKQLYMKKNSKI